MRSRRLWVATLCAAVFIILLALTISSPSFEKCEHDRKNHQSYEALHKEAPLFIKAIVRLRLHASCVRQTASENDGAITALSGIAVALFTLALWVSTDRLWKAGERQLKIAQRGVELVKRQAEIMDGQIAISKQQTDIMERQGAISESVNRARITITGVDTAVNTSIGQPLFRFKLKNVGLTPALDCEFSSNGLFRKISDSIPVFSVEDIERDGRRTGTVGQGVEFSSGWMVFEAAHLPDSADSPNTIYIWSLARYRDAFSGDGFRETESCFQISMLGAAGPKLEELNKVVSWRPAGTQNRST